MSKFYYIVCATTGDNVGEIEATDEQDAMKKLDSIFTPNDTLRKSDMITFRLINQSEFKTEGERIARQRRAEANA